MPPSSSEYPTTAVPYSRTPQQQQQQSGPSPGMIPSPMQQANLAGRNPLSPQPWPPQRQQQAPSHMSGPPTPQQQQAMSAAQQQQMNGNMMSGGTMQEMPSTPGLPHHMAASMEAEAHLNRPRSQDAQSAQQTVPDPSSEGDARSSRPDQSEFSLDKFVDNKEQAVEKQEDQDKPKASDTFSAPDFGPYQGDSSNSQPPKSDSESYQATPPPPVSAAASRPSSRAQSSNGMAANGPQAGMPPHPMAMGMPQMPPHGMPQGMPMGGPHGMPPSMHPAMGPGGMHMMGPPGHMMEMHSGPYMPPGPIGHQQEMAALQQQLQEFYCMPQQTQDIQSKVCNYSPLAL